MKSDEIGQGFDEGCGNPWNDLVVTVNPYIELSMRECAKLYALV